MYFSGSVQVYNVAGMTKVEIPDLMTERVYEKSGLMVVAPSIDQWSLDAIHYEIIGL